MPARRIALLTSLLVLAHCLGATEIELVLQTDLPCAQTNGVAIAVGPPGSESVVATSTACDNGGLGSLVIVPGDPQATVGILVTLGVVDASTGDECTGPDFLGCVVARRALRYNLHQALTVPILLQSACLDTVCGPNATCVDGNCVASCDPSTQQCADAGAGVTCTPPTLVVATDQQTPHIALTSSGYVVGYEAGGMFELAVLNQNGATTNMLELSPVLAGNVGPVAQTGAAFSGVFTAETLDAGLDFVATTIDSSGNLLMIRADRGDEVALEGLQYSVDSTDAGFFVSMALIPQQGSDHPAFIVCRPVEDGGCNAFVSEISSVVHPAIASGGGVFYGTYTDPTTQTCYVEPVTYDGTTIVLVPTGGAVFTPCYAMRVAVSPTLPPLLLLTGPLGMGGAFGPLDTNTALHVFGRADDEAVIALTSDTDAYRALWGFQGAISTARFSDLSTQPTPSTIAMGTGFDTTAGHGIGFDAVADVGTSFAVAYWAQASAGSGIYFTRCN